MIKMQIERVVTVVEKIVGDAKLKYRRAGNV